MLKFVLDLLKAVQYCNVSIFSYRIILGAGNNPGLKSRFGQITHGVKTLPELADLHFWPFALVCGYRS